MIKSVVIKEQKGITLIALVITIIVLLILAGVSISIVLGESGVLTQASRAVTKTNEAKVQEILEREVSSWIAGKYTGSGKSLADSLDDTKYIVIDNGDETYKVTYKESGYEFIVEENGKVTLEGVLSVGDYVAYTPNSASAYSTSTADSGYISSQSISQESLNWRVLDVVDGQVRLISETPTTGRVRLGGYQGYNNAVYILDDLCNTLYSGSEGIAQNLKIEDIEKYLTYDYTQYENSYVDTGKYGGTKEYTSSGYRYPSIFAQETTGWVDDNQGTTYGLSQQNSLINQTSSNLATSKIKITQTYWSRSMATTDFKEDIYYKLLIKSDITNENYLTYWLSSRCVDAYSTYAGLGVSIVNSGEVNANVLYLSSGYGNSYAYRVRPVVTLKSGIQVNTSDSIKDGTTAEKAYELK